MLGVLKKLAPLLRPSDVEKGLQFAQCSVNWEEERRRIGTLRSLLREDASEEPRFAVVSAQAYSLLDSLVVRPSSLACRPCQQSSSSSSSSARLPVRVRLRLTRTYASESEPVSVPKSIYVDKQLTFVCLAPAAHPADRVHHTMECLPCCVVHRRGQGARHAIDFSESANPEGNNQ